MIPLYIRYMGIEAYGLIGFYATLQALFQFFDMGLTLTISREAAKFNGRGTDAALFRQFFKFLEIIFIATAIIGGFIMVAKADYIANHWLNPENLQTEEVYTSIRLIAAIVVIRWVCGLYRSTINGLEQLIWLSSFNAAIATARFILVLPILIFISAGPKVFFQFQLAVAIIELASITYKTYALLPPRKPNHPIIGNIRIHKKTIKFSLIIALTSSAWIITTQIDKVILSSLLSLSEYGNFTLATLLASSITIITNPIGIAILPRMTRLQIEGKDSDFIATYQNATQLVAIIVIPACLVLLMYPKEILWIWSSNAETAAQAAPVLSLYALGNTVLSFTAFPYFLQFAKGDLRLHLIGSLCFILLMTPALTYLTLHYNAIGAGYAWLVANTLYFLLWTPVIHQRFLGSFHGRWLRDNICSILVPGIIAAILLKKINLVNTNKVELFFFICLTGLSIFLACIAGSNIARRTIRSTIYNQFHKNQ